MRTLIAAACTMLLAGACTVADSGDPPEAATPVAANASALTRDARRWDAVTDSSRAVTGPLALYETDYPPATDPRTKTAIGASVTTSVFTSLQGHVVTTVASGAVDGGAIILDEARRNTNLSAYLSVPRDAVLSLYTVLDEGPADTPKLCGETRPTAYLVVWRLEGGADMKLLPVTGAAPGTSGSTACAVFDYRGGGAG